MILKPFFIWQDNVLKKIKPEEVMCLFTEGNYTTIFLADKSYYMVRSTLSGALKKLPADVFIKVHRSFAASIFYIDTIERDHLTVGKEPIPIARRYYKSVLNQLNIIR